MTSQTHNSVPTHPFLVLPAIDLLDGRSVRLEKGVRKSAAVVNPDPFEQVEKYVQAGATWAHVVNLNAAFGDPPTHLGAISSRQILKQIISEGKLKLQIGGGIRTRAQALALLEMGVSRIVIGTWAVHAPEEVCLLAREYPELIVVGLDTVEGYVAIHGWKERSKLQVAEFGKHLFNEGVRYALHTEVERDGMLTGVDSTASAHLADLHSQTGLLLLASGGVRDVTDIEALSKIKGVSAAITGKALASETLSLKQALTLERNPLL